MIHVLNFLIEVFLKPFFLQTGLGEVTWWAEKLSDLRVFDAVCPAEV